MTVRELLARISSRELTEWQAYEKITGPLDTRLRGDIQASVISATVANSQSTHARAKPADFMPDWDKRKKTPEELWAAAMKANAALGGQFRTDT
ncbi:phage tail assembly protein T [Streptomyces sp. CA-250714]|uniref:phage tail assembly protein T n=1 Tax=Streptomyces sp. CA-250714 TaxID=3240060 RepID=UPI003D8C978E